MNILSLGAGVQSSAMLLMALAGEFDWFPDAAIFADTQAEGAHVYRQVEFLREQIAGRFPLYCPTYGNLETDLLEAVQGKRDHVYPPPFHVINRETKEGMPPDAGGILWRRCTAEYKIMVIRRQIRALWKDAGRPQVFQFIGISGDEIGRMTESRVKYITNVYPLIEKRDSGKVSWLRPGITRHDCELWLKRHGYPIPGKSACHFCPYRSNRGWREMKTTDPATFARACDFDDGLRANGGRLPGVTGEAYVHRSFQPLRMVDFDNLEDRGQGRLFPELIEECDGLCGV